MYSTMILVTKLRPTAMLELYASDSVVPATIRQASRRIMQGAIEARPNDDVLTLDPLTELARIAYDLGVDLECRINVLKFLAKFVHPMPRTIKIELPAVVDDSKIHEASRMLERMRAITQSIQDQKINPNIGNVVQLHGPQPEAE